MQSAFWSLAARHCRRVRLVRATNGGDTRWSAVALSAAANGLATDALYLARVDPDRLEALNARVRGQLESGAFEPATLYLLNDESTPLGRAEPGPAADLLGRVDGFVVLASGWQRCGECRATTDVAAVR